MPSKIFAQKLTWKAWLKVSLVTLAIVALIAYLIWDVVAVGPLMSLLTNREEVIKVVKSWGIFGPLAYIILQIIQTVVAPIPGQVVGSIGGFLFGPWGILWTTIGTVIGCYIVFRLARRFGRPLLEKIFNKELIDKFDFITTSRSAALVLFLIFILPGFPDDVICYIAGLTNLPIRVLMLILIAGRFPVIVVTNFIGDGIADNLPLVILVAAITIVILAIGVSKREKILTFLKSKSPSSDSKIIPPVPIYNKLKSRKKKPATPAKEPSAPAGESAAESNTAKSAEQK